MRKNTYKIRYRNQGQLFWRTLRCVIGDGVEPGLFRWFALEDGRMIYVALGAEVELSAERHEAIAEKMRKETGGQVNI